MSTKIGERGDLIVAIVAGPKGPRAEVSIVGSVTRFTLDDLREVQALLRRASKRLEAVQREHDRRREP